MKIFRYNYLFAIALFLLGGGMAGCDKECSDPLDPKCPNYDPCLTYNVHHAQFRVVDSVENNINFKDMNRGFDIDTTWTLRDIWFKAMYDADEYQWTVGTDPRVWTTKEFVLYFDVTGDITVRLVTYKKSEKECFPDSDGRDTFYHTFHLVPAFSDGPIYGTYKGHHQDTPDQEFEVTVAPPFPSLANVGVIGLPNGCTSVAPSAAHIGYNYIVVVDKYINCFEPKGVGILGADRKTLTIDYSYVTNLDTKERVTKKFIGVKQ